MTASVSDWADSLCKGEWCGSVPLSKWGPGELHQEISKFPARAGPLSPTAVYLRSIPDALLSHE